MTQGDLQETIFTNEKLDISALPRHEELEMMRIDKRYWQIILINKFVSTLVLLTMGSIAMLLIPDLRPFYWYALGLYLLFVLISLILSRAAFPKKKYGLRDKDISYQSGLLSTALSIVPFSRIQHVEIHESFLARQFDLATLRIFTAGGTSGGLNIPGLPKDDAQTIKEALMEKITSSEEEL